MATGINEDSNKHSDWIEKFELAKKPFDLTDDAWNASRTFIPVSVVESVGPSLVSIVLGVLHLGEGIIAGKKFKKVIEEVIAYRNKIREMDQALIHTVKKVHQRKMRITTHGIALAAATAGMGLSTAYFFGAMGFAVTAGTMALSTPLLPGLLTVIFVSNLIRRAYKLHIKQLEEEVAKAAYLESMHYYHPDREELYSKYIAARESRLKKERKVAFSAIELAGSILLVTGIALGTASLITLFTTASVASFGFLPFSLIIAGVAIGFFSKLFAPYDANKNYKYTDSLRNGFRKIFGLDNDEPIERMYPAFKNIHRENSMSPRDFKESTSQIKPAHKNCITSTPQTKPARKNSHSSAQQIKPARKNSHSGPQQIKPAQKACSPSTLQIASTLSSAKGALHHGESVEVKIDRSSKLGHETMHKSIAKHESEAKHQSTVKHQFNAKYKPILKHESGPTYLQDFMSRNHVTPHFNRVCGSFESGTFDENSPMVRDLGESIFNSRTFG